MDAAGADAVRIRIERHQHWLEAPAVRDGLQPARDPHAQWLLSHGDGIRLYADERGSFEKRLSEGAWKMRQTHSTAA